MRYTLFILLLAASTGFAQSITLAQEKALNNYVEYANHSADEVAAVSKSIIAYYPTFHQKRSYGAPRYTCPLQQEDYYLNNALKESSALPSAIQTSLNKGLKDLRAAADRIEATCKALDTYHKLEDYKQDNFEKAKTLVSEITGLLVSYKEKQMALDRDLEATFKKMTTSLSANAYHQANIRMRAEVARERGFLDLWAFNLEEEIHTGWPTDALQQSIADTDAGLKALQLNPSIKYPASSMWKSFHESLNSILKVKRDGLDEYNFEAKKSDDHSNHVYLSLINYFNGTLVSNQNAFIQYAGQDGYQGLKTMHYFPMLVIKAQPQVVEIKVTPFQDIPHGPVQVEPQKAPLAQSTYEILSNYVDYINETWRQTRNLQLILRNFNGTAARYRSLDTFDGRGGLSFDYKNFTLPLSQYQKTIADSKGLAPALSKSLNDQSTVLLNILRELDELSAALEVETNDKKYEKDHLGRIYEILERQAVLLETWDQRKEILYNDVRKVYDAYPPRVSTDSWYISGKVLRDLTDYDHEGLFIAKAYYSGGTKTTVPTEKIDETLRDVIAKEYDNMKGIKKIGRSNGLCPYTPYEDLPLTSKSLSEELKALKPVVNNTQTSHPYHRMIYHYNDIVDDYNKFCELSKDVFHLKTIKQPELYVLAKSEAPIPTAHVPVVPASTSNVRPPDEPVAVKENETQLSQPHPGKVLHDTIYIERRDTVFLTEPGENLHSMEGYATNNMILLLDVSGSMNVADKLPLLKKSVLDLVSMMRAEDEVSIIAFSEKPKAILTGASFADEARIKKAVTNLKSSGKTDGNTAVKLAYKIADENYIRGGNNRIILATDGEFAMHEDTQLLIEKFAREDIFLSVFNFGKGAGSSRALEKLADLGKGNYSYISAENVELKLIREIKAKKKK